MHATTSVILRRAALAVTLALTGMAWAADGPAVPAGPPAGFVAPAEPRPDETNAERGRSQPGNNAPFWRSVRDSGKVEGTTTSSSPEAGTLIQSFTRYPGSRYATAGEAWRQARNDWIIPYGGALLLLVVLAIGLFYWRKGTLGGHEPDTGHVIERFTYFERAAHWANAIAFCLLAVSGLVMAFGKFLLLPVLGGTLFGLLTYALKTVHNFAGPVFAVSLAVVFFTFVRDNMPRKGDMTWLRKGGGLLGDSQVPSHRFNAGEKIVFWGGVFLLGLAVVLSGLVLDMIVPGIDYSRANMQVANMVHGVATVLMMALFFGHIYIGTVGVKDASRGMRTGFVDEAWAREHHLHWYDDIKAGKLPARRTPDATPPVAPAAPH